MREMLEDLFTYNYHTNQLFIDALRKAEIADEKAIELLSHLLNAHAIWLERIEKKLHCIAYGKHTLLIPVSN